jgi:hypothetical protein
MRFIAPPTRLTLGHGGADGYGPKVQ